MCIGQQSNRLINGDNPTDPARSDVNTVIQTLIGNNAYTIESGIEGEDKFGTAPVRDAYLALGSTDLMSSIEAITGFIPKWQYPKVIGVLKLSLIDMEARRGDMAQAQAA